MEPALKTALIASIWFLWPLTARVPSRIFIPRDVPSVAYSISWTASAFPAKIASMYPWRISVETDSDAPVWIIAGPPTRTILPPFFLVRRISSATFLAICCVGLSLELPLPMNSNTFIPSLGLSGGIIFTPFSPTTILSPFFTWRIGIHIAFFPFTKIHLSIIMFSTSIHLLARKICVGLFVVL